MVDFVFFILKLDSFLNSGSFFQILKTIERMVLSG